jgi:hypothetical protein
MTDARLEALEERVSELLTSGGASVTVQDPRVSSMTRWIATVMGGVALLVMGWVANSINRLNETMSRVVTQNEAIMATQADHSDRLKELERRNASR